MPPRTAPSSRRRVDRDRRRSAQLEREVFGPVLHVVRWQRDELAALIDAINATGYGLTHGMHTRIDETVERDLSSAFAPATSTSTATSIGAVVGVQPFGGEGLSGTGPKAGGPLYLPRLMRAAGNESDACITGRPPRSHR